MVAVFQGANQTAPIALLGGLCLHFLSGLNVIHEIRAPSKSFFEHGTRNNSEVKRTVGCRFLSVHHQCTRTRKPAGTIEQVVYSVLTLRLGGTPIIATD